MTEDKPPKPSPSSRKSARAVGPDEKSLWDYAVRDATPLRPSSVPSAVNGAPDPRSPFMQSLRKKAKSSPQSIVPLAGSELRPKLPNKPVSALDRKTSQKLRNGRIPIDATLDLHGFRQAEAHHRLIRFVESCQGQGFKCVLVITGKGAPDMAKKPWGSDHARGVLRTALPNWLQTPPLDRYVVKYQSAHIHHGGTGAFYLFLRRRDRL